jgi:nicotinamide mononucleotide (NMN) deamidase PncC
MLTHPIWSAPHLPGRCLDPAGFVTPTSPAGGCCPPGNPVGLVYFACARKGGKCVGMKREFGDIGRSRIRYAAASETLALIARVASEQSAI